MVDDEQYREELIETAVEQDDDPMEAMEGEELFYRRHQALYP
ncbi:hypothetical protein O9992_05405 [Vibrio lentus]|nr:hypothetical protein [Vibrio lentus]